MTRFFSPRKKKNPLNIIITSGMETYPKICKKYFHKEPISCLLQMQDVQPSGSEKDYASLQAAMKKIKRQAVNITNYHLKSKQEKLQEKQDNFSVPNMS